MQSETQQYDITVGAKEQRQQGRCSDKMASAPSPGAIAEPGVWSNSVQGVSAFKNASTYSLCQRAVWKVYP